MTSAEALSRALDAIKRALINSDHFDHGGLASHEIMNLLRAELRKEFAQRRLTDAEA